jgi:hypothetical protein
MYFVTQTKNNISALELRRLLGIGYCAAWRIKHKLMQVMLEREQATTLSGRVEVAMPTLEAKTLEASEDAVQRTKCHSLQQWKPR